MTALTLPPPPPTANQRFKDSFGLTLALSLMAATAMHALLFDLEAQAWADRAGPPMTVIPGQEVKLPPPPEVMAAPAAPVISALATATETLHNPSFERVPEVLPPPPPPSDPAQQLEPTWTGPFEVYPSLANHDEMRRALERAYPSLLKDAGIGGTVGLALRIGTGGQVLEARIAETSGHPGLDKAALQLSSVMRFHPAMHLNKAVSVWVQIPVTFEVHGRPEALEAGFGNR